MPPNPDNNGHGFAMRSMSLCDMQILKSEKKILGPPLPNPGDAPVYMRINSTFLSDYHEQTNVMNLAKEIDAIFRD